MDPTSENPVTKIDSSLDRVDELLSAYLDNELEPEAFEELNATLDTDDIARKRCVETVSLHIDLLNYFGKQPSIAADAISDC